MSRGFKVVAAVVAGCLGLSFAAAAEPKPSRPAVESPAREPDQQLVFKTTPQGELKLHVYLPTGWSNKQARPAIVFWFGGGFAKGSVAAFSRQSAYFASRGLVAICAEYRIKSKHGTEIDLCVEDARSAMRWVKIHARDLGIDHDKIVASGGSAGGTLALAVALADGPDAADDPVKAPTRPCALVLFNPAQGQVIDRFTQEIRAGDEEKARRKKLLAAIDRPQLNEPPAIFFFGSDDPLLDASCDFCRKALEIGDRAELWTAAGQGHTFFNRSPWYEATLRKADEFLASLGYLQGPPTIAASPDAVLKQELLAPLVIPEAPEAKP